MNHTFGEGQVIYMFCKLKPITAAIAGLGAAIALSACGTEEAPATGPLPVKQVYHSSHCQVETKRLAILNSQAELEKAVASAVPGVENTAASMSNVDFDSERIVLVAWGRQNNSGYRLELVDEHAETENSVVELPVKFVSPSPDGFYAQVMTSPCLIVALPKAGYNKIRAGEMEIRDR